MLHDHPEICKGFTAISVNLLAVITSTQEHLEFWLRCTSLVIGIAVGIATIISIIRKMPR